MKQAPLPSYWSATSHKWRINLPERRFVSPPAGSGDDADEALIAQVDMKNGRISASLSFEDTRARDAGFLFRYSQETGCIAGLGGWDARFFLAEVFPPPKKWRLIARAGNAGSLFSQKTYSIRVEFSGKDIVLYEGGVEQLRGAQQASFSGGQIGLYADGCKVIFSDVDVPPKTCVVAMPFAPEHGPTYACIKKAVQSRGLVCYRSDKIRKSRPIMEELVEEIERADLVIGDLTDGNANVYYEIGLAHALNRPCILIAPSGNDVKFDLRGIRTLYHHGDLDGVLLPELKKWIDESLNGGGFYRLR